ncbi:GroES-like protein [Cylindrobasidium torrendii FP15055 ss-10]|uniref:GroES-like protein n=1 Tax=Cylindrobasidium torrendii FP15055 ss-10 TaxID=1314674 RepID=A0A0D7AZQ8_9AGAR|nr:GroES-like protein [Cylindrobasidium torrendii FP15055 ss-10]
MSTNLALVLPAANEPLRIEQRPIPTPGAGQLLIKIHAAALNPLDCYMASVGAFVESWPHILGEDYAGEVVEVGAGVSGWSKGDRIMYTDLKGSFQQYQVIPAEFTFKLPSNISYDEAATTPMTLATGFVGLFANSPLGVGLNPTFSRNQPQKGQSALVIGGSTSVGQFVIQQLKFLGFTTVVAYASARHAEYLKTLGATEVIDRNTVPLNNLPSTLARQFNVVYDAVSAGDSFKTSVASLGPGGKVVFVLTPPDEIYEKLSSEGKTWARVYGFTHRFTPGHDEFGRLQVEHVPKLLEEGIIKPNRFEVLPGGLRGVADGLERLRAGKVSGVKLVVHPYETEL